RGQGPDPARRGGHDLYVLRRREQLQQAAPHHGMVVGYHHADQRTGTSRTRRVPAPGREWMSRRPPASSASSARRGRPMCPVSRLVSPCPGTNPTPLSSTLRRMVFLVPSTVPPTLLA